MILGLSSRDRSWQDAVTAVLARRGYEAVDLAEWRAPVGGMDTAACAARWGGDWLIRLAAEEIPTLANVVVLDLRDGAEIDGMVDLQYRRSTPVRFLLMDPPDGVAAAVQAAGLPHEEWEPGAEVAAEARIARAVRSLPMGPSRPSWDEYFMRIARVVASRSDCVRRQVAAILVKDRRVIGTGYNGTPRGAPNCSAVGCPRCASDAPSGTRLDECLCLHAEENAILQAAYHGTSVHGAILYCTASPCLLCTKKIINSGVLEVVYDARYSIDERSMSLLHDCGILVRRYRPDPRRPVSGG